MTATREALETDVRPDACDPPPVPAARVGLAQRNDIVNLYVDPFHRASSFKASPSTSHA